MKLLAPSFAILLLSNFALAADSPIARLPAVSDHPSDPVLAKMFDGIRARGGQPLNLHLIQGHAPELAKLRAETAYAIRFNTTTPPLIRELAILRVGAILNTEYDRKQHIPMARACGLTDAQLATLEHWRGSAAFDAREQALLAYVDALMAGGEVDDATFGGLARHFDPRQIVEITLIVGNYFTTGVLTKALRIEPETDGRASVRGKC